MAPMLLWLLATVAVVANAGFAESSLAATRKCYVGLRVTPVVAGPVVTNGAEMACPGACANNTIYLPNYTFDIYTCDSFRVCGLFGGDDQCKSITNGDLKNDAFRECCCTSGDNCNAIGQISPIPTLPPKIPAQNETCFTGASLDGLGGTPIGMPMPCRGACANYTINGLTLYACDPVSVCQSFGLGNGNVGCTGKDGLNICCCEKQNCNIANPPAINKDLSCFVGLSMSNAYIKGAVMACPSGQCSNVTLTMNNFPMTAYMCDPLGICPALGIKDNSCQKSTVENKLGGCCCDSSNNCNVGDQTKIPPKTHNPPKTSYQCFMGFQLNSGAAFGFNVTHCAGDCARIGLGNFTFYTCDPIDTCRDFELNNECRLFNGIKGCCCKGNNCNDVNRIIPMNKPPIITQQRCFVGMTAPGFVAGGELGCHGKCANATTTVMGKSVSAFMCDPVGMCGALGIGAGKAKCTKFSNDISIDGCCCEGDANCNVADKTLIPTPGPVPRPIVCHEGFWVNGLPLTAINREIVCHGDCGKLTFNTTISNFAMSATIYTCDPVSVCKGLAVSNGCKRIDGLVDGCCCNSDMCLDPANNITYPQHKQKMPPGELMCYVGVQIQGKTIGNGATIPCKGACSNTTINVSGSKFTIYTCDGLRLCGALGIEDTCGNDAGDAFMHGCCCRNGTNCNAPPGLTNIPTMSPEIPDVHHTCFVGASMALIGSGSAIGMQMPCNGQCANYTVAGFSVYACDPVSVCQSMGALGKCLQDDKMEICCCGTKDCNLGKKPSVKPDLTCYVGLTIGQQGSFYHKGTQMACPYGQCANATMSMKGTPVTVHTCDPFGLCPALNITNGQCNNPAGIANLQGCCCQTNNCNFYSPSSVTTTKPLNRHNLTCFEGISVTGKHRIGFDVQCPGDCARVHMKNNISLYTCDPIDSCHDLGLQNDCLTIGKSMKICCCETDHCNDVDQPDPVNGYPTPPPSNLQCLVGMSINGKLMGGNMLQCDGKCANVTTTLYKKTVTAFMCDPIDLCTTLLAGQNCMNTHGDLGLYGCCCDNADKCNYNGTATIPPLVPSTNAIACPEGIWFHGKSLGDPNRIVGCRGDCGSVTLRSSLNGIPLESSLYMCDPAALCKSFGFVNTCVDVENIGTACCCNGDMCLDPVNGVTYPQHAQPMPAGDLMCYVGVQIQGKTIGNGASVPCAGSCSNTTINVLGSKFSIYTCDRLRVCGLLGIEDTCGKDAGNAFMHGCCCRGGNNCNAPAGLTNIPTMSPYIPDLNQTCFVGAAMASASGVPGSPIGTQMPCNGACANYTVAGFSVFACDPVSVCESLGVIEQCVSDDHMEICCCAGKDCNLGNLPSRKKELQCYVGMAIGDQGQYYLKGSHMGCPWGQCANTTMTMRGTPITVYTCDPFGLCPALNTSGQCNSPAGLPNIHGCCCQDSNMCNVFNQSAPTSAPPSPDSHPKTIKCFTGFSHSVLTGNKRVGFDVDCTGECARIHVGNFSVYTCDPIGTCNDMGVSDDCVGLGYGMEACCCSVSHCNDVGHNMTKWHPTPPPSHLTCLVGVAVNNKLMGGSLLQCDGMCANMTTQIYNQSVTAYVCDPVSMCETLQLNQRCMDVNGDLLLRGCCCDHSNNCNYPQKPNVGPVKPHKGAIACPEGIWLNGKIPIGDPNRLVGCRGDCGSFKINTTVSNMQLSATLYTCDPADLCTSFNLTNKCLPLESFGQACCCNSDLCMDPVNNVTLPLPPPSPTKKNNGASALGISLTLLLASLLMVFRN